MSTKTTTQTTTQEPIYTRKQGAIAKLWTGSTDVLSTAVTTTHAVVTHGGSAIASGAKLMDTLVSGVSEIGIIYTNSMVDTVLTDVVIEAMYAKVDTDLAMKHSGFSEEQYAETKARLARGTK